MVRDAIRGLLTSGIVLTPATSFAQTVGAGTTIVIAPELDRNDVAGARIEPEYQPRTIRLGPFLAQPALSLASAYASNVFNKADARTDAVAMVMPALELTADTTRHELKMTSAGTIRRFARYQSENSEEWDVTGKGRLDLSPRHAITATADYAHLIEPRSSAGTAADAKEPVNYSRATGKLGTDLEFGNFRLSPSAGYQQVRYASLPLSSGTKIDQSFRDARTLQGEVRISYDFSGMVAAYAAASYGAIHSTSAPADIRRDARNTTAIVGLKGALSPVVTGEIGLGYQSRSFELPIYRDFAGFTFRADMQWFATPLLTLRAQANRIFQNSGDRSVAGILTDTFQVSAYYDPLRNFRIAASTALERGRYREVDTRTTRGMARLNAQYRMNRGISLGAYVSLLHQEVRGTPLVSEFTALNAGIGITITP